MCGSESETATTLGSGVYVWMLRRGEENTPLYIGLFGDKAKQTSLKQRFSRHVGGFNRAHKYPDKNNKDTRVSLHWNGVIYPEMLDILNGGSTVEVYFCLFERSQVDKIEMGLIEQIRPRWNAAKNPARVR